jgi:short-subunit dehydrogenase
VPSRVLITGASSGLGAELARRYGARGAELLLIARRRERLEEVAKEVRSLGGEARVLPLDLLDSNAAHQALRAEDEEQPIDLVIANAGDGKSMPLARTPWSLTRDTLRLDLEAALATFDAILPGMIARQSGHLVGMSSLAALAAVPGSPSYGAAKAGLSHWLDSARPELAAQGVSVTIIEPGFVRTPLTAGNRHDMPFLLELEDAVDRILRAIDGRKARLRFPRRLCALILALRALPLPLRDLLTRRFVVEQIEATASREERLSGEE